VTFTQASQAWIDEKQFCEPLSAKPTKSMEEQAGHYTQIIWPQTTRVGMASFAGVGGTYIVARYSPRGNIVRQTPWRQSDSNPYDSRHYGNMSHHEEKWTKRHGLGHQLGQR
jgi:hypothetical protein